MCKPVSLFIRLIPQRIRRRMKARKATLAKAEAAAKISQLTLNRCKKLLGTQYISQQDYDTAWRMQQANAAVVAAKAAVETARISWPIPK